MKRTKFIANTDTKKISVNSEIVARMALANLLGQSFGGDRDLYNALGYPKAVGYNDFVLRYKRQDIAKAVIKRPVETTWAGNIEVLEASESEDTAFETAFDKLQKDFKLKTVFSRLDRLTCLGRYGVLLMGFDDVKEKLDFMKPTNPRSISKLLYLKALSEGSAKIESYETNTKSERYGLPKFYEIILKTTIGNGTTSATIKVHYSRVIHVAWDLMEDDTEGTPVMESIFNRLMDIEKLVGGSSEMFWKGARPGYQGVIDKEYNLGSEEEKDLDNQVDEYEHGLRRIFTAQGIELKNLAPQVSDPTAHVAVQVQMICSITGIPQRVLLGSERGELASGQDANLWKTLIQDRRTEQVEPNIIRAFVDKMIEVGILPSPSSAGYTIMWSDLFAPSEKERAETGKTRAAAVQQFLQNPIAPELISVDAFVQFFLGLSKEQIELFHRMKDVSADEESLFQKMIEIEEAATAKKQTQTKEENV